MQVNNVKFIITHIYHVLIYSLVGTVVFFFGGGGFLICLAGDFPQRSLE